MDRFRLRRKLGESLQLPAQLGSLVSYSRYSVRTPSNALANFSTQPSLIILHASLAVLRASSSPVKVQHKMVTVLWLNVSYSRLAQWSSFTPPTTINFVHFWALTWAELFYLNLTLRIFLWFSSFPPSPKLSYVPH